MLLDNPDDMLDGLSESLQAEIDRASADELDVLFQWLSIRGGQPVAAKSKAGRAGGKK